VLDDQQKSEIVADTNEFLLPKSVIWYANLGIAHRRGCLFWGPPGTGKSSMKIEVTLATKQQIRELFVWMYRADTKIDNRPLKMRDILPKMRSNSSAAETEKLMQERKPSSEDANLLQLAMNLWIRFLLVSSVQLSFILLTGKNDPAKAVADIAAWRDQQPRRP
jgi:hypothetical protein